MGLDKTSRKTNTEKEGTVSRKLVGGPRKRDILEMILRIRNESKTVGIV